MKTKNIAANLTLLLCLTPALLSAEETQLADAAEAGDWSLVGKLCRQQADPNAAQADGMTALIWSVWHDHIKSTTELVRCGANVRAKNRYGVAALSLACRNGNTECVRLLLNAGADANTTLPGGETALMTAARTGRVAVVDLLLQRGANVNAQEHNSQTAIMWAAAEGHGDVVASLLEAGAKREASLKSGFNPFFFAVRDGRSEVVDVLLSAGSDVNATMEPTVKGGRIARKGTSALLLAVENGHFELAVQLLKAGADPNDQRSGFTALHAITWVRKPNFGDGLDGDPPPIGSGTVTSLELVKKLVEHGANVNSRSSRGQSGRGRLNRKGATAFLMAADTADVPLMKTLLDLGADPTIPNADQCPPLLAAAGIGTMAPGEEAGSEEEALQAVELLLKLGADINAVDANGETAMHGAAYKNLPKMVQLLAERGADVNVWNRKNKYGWTPLAIAQGYRPGNFKPAPDTIQAILRVMKANGVEPPKVDAKTTDAVTPYKDK